MANLSIIVNGNQELDFIEDDDFPIIFNRNVTDLNEISSRGGDVTYTLKLPSTPRNLQILELSLEKEVVNKFNNSKKINVDCYVNTNKIFSGYFVIDNYNKKTIQGNLRSYLISWSKDLQKKNLTDLNFDEVDFFGMETIIENINNYNLTEPDILPVPFVFPLISRGVFFDNWRANNWISLLGIKYINTTDQSNYINLPSNSPTPYTTYTVPTIPEFNITPQTVPHLSFQDIPPSFFLVDIIRRIFKDIGYSVGGKQINDKSVNTLIIPAQVSNSDYLNYNYNTLGRLLAYTPVQNDVMLFSYKNINGANNYGQFEQKLEKIQFSNRGFLNYTNALKYNKYAEVATPGTQRIVHDYNYGIFYNEDSGVYIVPCDGEYELNLSIVYRTFFRDQRATVTLPNSQVYYDYAPNFDGSADFWNWVPYIALVRFNDDDFDSKFVEDVFSRDTTTIPGTVFYDPVFVQDRIVKDKNTNQPFLIRLDSLVNEAKSLDNQIVDLNRNERYKLIIITYSVLDNFTLPYNNLTDVTLRSINFEIKPLSSTEKFRIQDNLPEISQAEFLKDVIKLFNLYYTIDPINKFIIFEPYNNFYLKSPLELKDIPDYSYSPAQLYGKYNFKYTHDDDDVLFGKDENTYNYDFITNLNDTLEDTEIESLFSPTKLQEYHLVNNLIDDTQSIDNVYKNIFRKPTLITSDLKISVPQISKSEQYKSDQQVVKYNTNVTPAVIEPSENLVGQSFNSNNIRILKLSDYDASVNNIKVRAFDKNIDGDINNTDIITNLPKLIKAKFIEDSPLWQNKEVDSLDQETLFNKNYSKNITLLQTSEIMDVDVLLDDDSQNQMQPNKLIKIGQNIYSLISLSGYKPIGIVPTKLKLLKIK